MVVVMKEPFIRCLMEVCLLGCITPNIRAVDLLYDEKAIQLFFYYEKTPSEEEKDLTEDIITEMYASIANIKIIMNRLVVPTNQPIPLRGITVYQRYEPITEIVRDITYWEHITIETIRCAGQKSLLGTVTPNVRGMSITYEDNQLQVFYYYESSPSNLENTLFYLTIDQVKAYFPAVNTEAYSTILPLLTRVPSKGLLIYHRCENEIV